MKAFPLLHRIIYVFLFITQPSFLPTLAENPDARPIKFTNLSGHRVEIYWINPNTDELVKQTKPAVFNGADYKLNSFIGHKFEIREVPHKTTGLCQDSGGDDNNNNNQCRSQYITVNENRDQIVQILPGMTLDHIDNIEVARRSAADMLTYCEDRAIEASKNPNVNSTEVVLSLRDCFETQMTTKIKEVNEDIRYQETIRKRMSGRLENYTCDDYSLTTTKPEETKYWTHSISGVTREVGVLHERDSSKIHIVKDFISDDECVAIEKDAEGRLGKATTANKSGGSHYSESRRAMQASVRVPWDREAEGDPIAVLSRRIYDYTNSATNYGLQEFGQENLMSIQYFGRGDDDDAPDRYKPHCDGKCIGEPHRQGGRVATMIMYCTVPEKGGTTNFRNAGVHVVPEKGHAVFFSYMDPKTKIMDNGLTIHSGCPVIRGTKRIVTQWMRMGVTSETPHTAYNTLDIKKSDDA